MPQSRLILVSNRLPVTVRLTGNEVTVEQSSGGLATGLRGPHQKSNGVWLGWPGVNGRLSSAKRESIEAELTKAGAQPVYLSADEVRGFYEDYSNGAIWPVFHSLIDQLPLEIEGWLQYRRVNEKFAKAVADVYRQGDIIWVHDYQLLLLPGLIRELIPDATIGFFLHIPFPSREVFEVLPQSAELLTGVLGADLIGFHTASYQENFVSAAVLEGTAKRRGDQILLGQGERVVGTGTFPMGIDVAGWRKRAQSRSVQALAKELREEFGGRTLVLGVDRLDYTKGLLRRIRAMERFFEHEPSLAESIHYVQVTVPSREGVESYAGLQRRLNELVGQINARFGTATSTPIHLIHRSLPEEEVSALYCAADVMLVTPLRDGMNLVAKEYVASHEADDGVLVLSQFAGASAELDKALIVNPYDIDGMARSIRDAVLMSLEEQQERMKDLRQQIFQNDVHKWADSFLNQLSAV